MTASLFVQGLINGLNQGAIYALIALGYTMVYGIIRMINFAHGDFIMIGAYTLFYTIPLMVNAGMPAWMAVIIAIVVCALVGVLVEILAYKPVRKAGSMSALITALAMSIFLENLAMVLFGANPHNVQAIFSLLTVHIGTVSLPLNMLTISIGLLIMLAMQFFVKKTNLGKLLRLASDDSGISEVVFAKEDENTRKTLLYKVSQKVYDGKLIPPESGNFTSDENLFNYQSPVLRELLDCESYVCVGRAADFVLRDKPNVLKVYIDAPYEARVAREVDRQGISRWEASHYIDRLDRYRESNYKYHTGRQWKVVSNFDLCLDTAALGLDNCVEIIKKVIELKFGVKAPK